MQKLWQEAFEEQMKVMKEKFASIPETTNDGQEETTTEGQSESTEHISGNETI
jgi:hypothetical protein